MAGGASGGHLYPGIAVAEALKELDPQAEILFLCTERPIDREILQKSPWPFETQPVKPIPRPRLKEIVNFFQCWRASMKLCRRIMQQEKPAAVLGLGGFASGPALKTASRLQVPTAMLNPDALPGRANRFCRKYAQRIFVQWQQSLDHFGEDKSKCIVTGCPIRKEFVELTAKRQKNNKEKLMLIMGGSQGGRNLNQAVVKTLTEIRDQKSLLQHWHVVHITGTQDKLMVEEKYQTCGLNVEVLSFSHQMPQLLVQADLVIGRAGASSLAELTATGIPSILLPYPYHKDQHQLCNGRILEQVGAAKVVIDQCDEFKTAQALKDVLEEILTEEERLEQMARAAAGIGKPDAALRVAHHLSMLTSN